MREVPQGLQKFQGCQTPSTAEASGPPRCETAVCRPAPPDESYVMKKTSNGCCNKKPRAASRGTSQWDCEGLKSTKPEKQEFRGGAIRRSPEPPSSAPRTPQRSGQGMQRWETMTACAWRRAGREAGGEGWGAWVARRPACSATRPPTARAALTAWWFTARRNFTSSPTPGFAPPCCRHRTRNASVPRSELEHHAGRKREHVRGNPRHPTSGAQLYESLL